MACAPDGIPSPIPMLKGVAYTPELRDLGIFVDPIFSISSSLPGELFTQVEWSPMGCCELGRWASLCPQAIKQSNAKYWHRCLLTCCTKSGNLLIYSPPSLCITQWKRVCTGTVPHHWMHCMMCTGTKPHWETQWDVGQCWLWCHKVCCKDQVKTSNVFSNKCYVLVMLYSLIVIMVQ